MKAVVTFLNVRHWLIALCVWAFLPQAAVANDAIGRVILVVGDTWAQSVQGERRELKRGDDIFVYDTLFTGADSRAHIRFTDGSSTRLQADTRFRVAQYYYREDDPNRGAAVFQLLKGGLRTISGNIGKAQPEKYRLQTTLATIGIRGTEYEAYVCDICCALESEKEEGVAGGVAAGGINVDTAVGAADLDPGQYFVIRPDSESLEVLDYRPAFLGGEAPEPTPEPEPVPAPSNNCVIDNTFTVEDGSTVYERGCVQDLAGE
ncbi:MAG: FecR family protein [Pontibacterium sp.]